MKHLTATEQYLWNFIETSGKNIPEMSIVELSEAANVSTATIVRTMKKMGYDGYTSFRHSLKHHKLEEYSFESLDRADDVIKRAIYKNKQEVFQTIENLDSALLEDAVQKIFSADRVIIFARGLSELVAEEISLKLRILEKYCEVYTDPNIIIRKCKHIRYNDFVLFISLNGETIELVAAAKQLAASEISTLLITSNSSSTLAKLCDLVFLGFKTKDSYFPEYEVKSRLPLVIISRILVDAYAARINIFEKDVSN